MVNKKGMTLVEMIVSIVLISIVLILLMNLFINIRSVYNKSKIQSDYNMLSSTIIKVVSTDIENYGLKDVQYKTGSHGALVLTFNSFRPTKLSEPIVKVLKIYEKNNRFYISYAYDSDLTDDLTSTERTSSEIRTIPEDAYIDRTNLINFEQKSLSSSEKLVKIKIPLTDNRGNVYDINIYGIIDKNI